MKIYVASSWRNKHQPLVVGVLRAAGHEVYDFRNPPNRSGFAWGHVNPRDWQEWTPEEHRAVLDHPVARAGYESDRGAIDACDVCVLVLPSGRSASWEFGYAFGLGKRCIVFMAEPVEPELMYREAEFAFTMAQLGAAVERAPTPPDTSRDEGGTCEACKGTGRKLLGEGATATFDHCYDCKGTGQGRRDGT